MYQASLLEEVLLQRAKDTHGNQMYLYGDMGYNISPVMIVPHPRQRNHPSTK
ncbi:hypothetical protein K457DRAFT_143426 [Linnemannia elongata AG-77]|uniref:Uncharacterized protein n=1 Tax=Linnemannia elongata AG-77 TaxID=1314771 RepID=A0A197JDC2_9FUNG|nr:hypothetical protein K457DRAFT_143426 [Linnemannia elongata AG-77]